MTHEFTWEVIDSVDNWKDACNKEKEYIIKFGSHVPNGYNMTKGGDGTFGLKRSQEQIKGMAERCSIPIFGIHIKTNKHVWFTSTMDASRKTTVPSGNIRKCLTGDRPSAKGWDFYTLDIDTSCKKAIKRFEVKNNFGAGRFPSIKVKDSDGIIYNSKSEVCKQNKLTLRVFNRILKNNLTFNNKSFTIIK